MADMGDRWKCEKCGEVVRDGEKEREYRERRWAEREAAAREAARLAALAASPYGDCPVCKQPNESPGYCGNDECDIVKGFVAWKRAHTEGGGRQ